MKTPYTLVAAGTSNLASGTTTGTVLDLTTALGAVLTALVTNGTAPTVGCDFVVEVSHNNTDWKEFSRVTAPVTASAATPFAVELPAAVMYARPKFTANTGQAVTVECFAHELTSIG